MFGSDGSPGEPLAAGYGTEGEQRRRVDVSDDDEPRVPDIAVVGAAVVVAIAVRLAGSRAGVQGGAGDETAAWNALELGAVRGLGVSAVVVAFVALAAGAIALGARRSVPVLIAVGLVYSALGTAGAVRANDAWHGVAPDTLGAYAGWARVVDDPQPFTGTTRVILELDGERFELWVRGRVRQLRALSWRGGDYVEVVGERRSLDRERAHRVAWQHVVGELRAEWLGDRRSGSPLDAASNRIRAAIERAGEVLPGDDGALYRGLVVGDDRDQPRAMIERFRASGLAHLTAVSGQNVAFVLAAAGPLLGRLAGGARLAVTFGLIAWFVALTRFEPSIVRAGAMAMLTAFAVSRGRERSAVRVLALAVVVLLLLDPLIAWSIGFWLSVGATAGVTVIGGWLSARWSRLGGLAAPLGATLGAQAGVALPAVLVFGRLPLVSIPANLLAAPVAGAVMLYGLPAGLLAGAVPAVAPVVMFPCRLGVRWVDTVAALGERVEPGPTGQLIGWFLTVAAVLATVAVAVVRGQRGSSVAGDSPHTQG